MRYLVEAFLITVIINCKLNITDIIYFIDEYNSIFDKMILF